MAFGTKTNERPGTRAQVRYLRVSPYKAREVLDLIRGLHIDDADGVLEFTDRAVAADLRKVLASAVANAAANDELDPNELYVSACYADEGPTLKRWPPRARARATRIPHRPRPPTVLVSRLALSRGLHIDDADGVLEFTDRAVAADIRKVLASAVANAEANDELDPNELYVSACYADEGPTLKRWRPRARGRATRIRKRTCHITVIVSRMDPKKLEQRRARTEAAVGRGGVRRDAAEARDRQSTRLNSSH